MTTRFFIISLSLAAIAGCANQTSQQRLDLLASNRASVISAELPIEAGPLSIMQSTAKGSTIEIMMVYNQDLSGAKPLEQVINNGINYYCSNKDTKANLETGLNYRLKMRNTRGQLIADQLVTDANCTSELI
ncbi:GspS/AspS pilotin family protein (plasmid) [Vibrio scophthalmi]|uniref:GspS/AspS pilotin family protein n=1 Tax=Vibrio scophthalmi TaxID=45658 RepID=UPI0008096084|nr:GspS/AspS pilotin family protein [Vibrio scophthalmi]ANS88196.1 hypothetical protein VSVS12_04498 [Vibrio scophthalmi]